MPLLDWSEQCSQDTSVKANPLFTALPSQHSSGTYKQAAEHLLSIVHDDPIPDGQVVLDTASQHDESKAFYRRIVRAASDGIESFVVPLLQAYRKIGSRSGRDERAKWWRSQGPVGVEFLLHTSREERNVERAQELSRLLMTIATPTELVLELEVGPVGPLHYETVLRAISWLAPLSVTDHQLFLRTVQTPLRSPDPDVRSAAVECAAELVPRDQLTTLLQKLRDSETDEDVRDAIEDALG